MMSIAQKDWSESYLRSMIAFHSVIQLHANISAREKNGQDIEFVENTVQQFYG